jgi:hypothetical protein
MRAAMTRYVVRQPRVSSSQAVSGANTVEARPATSVMAVSARTRRRTSVPAQPVMAAKAGAYKVADIAKPASTQPA